MKVEIKEAGIETITINEFLILCKKTTLQRQQEIQQSINHELLNQQPLR
jgi:hypothetical protein